MAQSKAEDIFGVLRSEILIGQYRSGERLPSERDLAARFESNRGLIREAIKKLEQLGIVEDIATFMSNSSGGKPSQGRSNLDASSIGRTACAIGSVQFGEKLAYVPSASQFTLQAPVPTDCISNWF